jgi:hypothetical protein
MQRIPNREESIKRELAEHESKLEKLRSVSSIYTDVERLQTTIVPELRQRINKLESARSKAQIECENVIMLTIVN